MTTSAKRRAALGVVTGLALMFILAAMGFVSIRCSDQMAVMEVDR